LTTYCTVLTEQDGMDRNEEYTTTTSPALLVRERDGMQNNGQMNTAEYMSIREMECTMPVQGHNGTTASNSFHVIFCLVGTMNCDAEI